MHREHHSWISQHLGRRMDFMWYGHWGPAVLIFPTSMGKYYENEDQGLVGSLADKINNGQLQVCCVDSVDAESWYCRWAHPLGRAWRHHQYDQYLRWELIPYMLHRTHDWQISVYGASFGAYHAANIAARYPHLVRKAICFSGSTTSTRSCKASGTRPPTTIARPRTSRTCNPNGPAMSTR